MDKGAGAGSSVKRWDWLPAFMPGVARLMKERRREWGDEHVNRCWQAGVVRGEPGWFFAWEGPIAIGTPFDAEVLQLFAALPRRGPAMLHLREPSDAKA